MCCIWVLAILGISFCRRIFRSLNCGYFYLLLGWMAQVAFPQLEHPTAAIGILMIAGGITYTVGKLFTLRNVSTFPWTLWFPRNFHLLYLLSVLHFIMIQKYIVPL